jgi:hypothetical protein
MIGLSAPLYDPDGAIGLQEMASSELYNLTRRVNRTKTLDGGVAVSDGGHSAGDRNLVVRWRVRGEAQYRAVQRLARLYPRLTVATREGVFEVAPESVQLRSGEGELRLLVLTKWSET